LNAPPTPDQFERRWRDRFAWYAEHFDDDASIAGWTHTGLATRHRQFARQFRRSVTGERWLDAGCGAGTYARYLAGLGAMVLGLDYSIPTASKANRLAVAGTAFCVGDATNLPVKPASLDGAICLGVTQALASSDRLVRSLAQAVRPGGEVWVDALNAGCAVHLLSEGRRRLRRLPPHLRYERPSALRSLMRSQGLSDVRIIWLPILPARLQFLQPLLESPAVLRLLQAFPPLGALISHSFIACGRRIAGEAAR
jgi:SAM-dependent methyltransferase